MSAPPRRLPRRLVQLYAGLVAFALGEALCIRARLGVIPWDVLHQGLARRFGLSIGLWSVIVAGVVLLAWVPLRERPGVGTVSNAVVIGLVLDRFLAVLPTADTLWVRWLLMVGGILTVGVASAAYIGARLGPGPRDGLMTGLVRITGRSVRVVRTGIEVVVVIAGWALGGNLGLGTLAFAVLIGPIIHPLLPLLTVPGDPAPTVEEGAEGL